MRCVPTMCPAGEYARRTHATAKLVLGHSTRKPKSPACACVREPVRARVEYANPEALTEQLVCSGLNKKHLCSHFCMYVLFAEITRSVKIASCLLKGKSTQLCGLIPLRVLDAGGVRLEEYRFLLHSSLMHAVCCRK